MTRILVIEDNPNNMKLVAVLLEKSGYEVLQARDAQSGIALARLHQPDLILMDIQLPDMDGLAAIQVLRNDSLTQHCKVFALTAYAMKGDEDKFLAAGFDGYFSKPIRYQDFLEALAAMFPAHTRAMS